MIPLGGVLLNDRTTSVLLRQSGLIVRVAADRFRSWPPSNVMILKVIFSSARTCVCRNGDLGPLFGPVNRTRT